MNSREQHPTPDNVHRDEACVFSVLLTLAVVGRWAEPAWHFTPLAAVTAFGGYYFRHWLPAILLPASALAISDLTLPAHDSVAVMAVVQAMTILPLTLGRAARNAQRRRTGKTVAAVWWGLCGFLPATAFFLATNFAVWAFQSDYPSNFAGLVACYVNGLPFYRTMLAGDLTYLALLWACWAWTAQEAPSAWSFLKISCQSTTTGQTPPRHLRWSPAEVR